MMCSSRSASFASAVSAAIPSWWVRLVLEFAQTGPGWQPATGPKVGAPRQSMFRISLNRWTEIGDAMPAVIGLKAWTAGESPAPLLGGEGGDDEQRECWK